MKKFLITTPIYYPNWYPHIGHAYSSFIADFYARYKRLIGYDVKFSTGNDENSQKNLQKAEDEWKNIIEYLDEMAEKWKTVWNDLEISFTDFIRTTQKDHKKLVQKVLDITYKKWDIYEWEYKWYYCVGCEGFKTEKDLILNERQELVCPDHMTKPEILTEKNWFFRLKNYEDKIKKFYKDNPDFVVPDYRFNEVKSFVNSGLEDFSVSRETNKFWIPLPFDKKQVTYVRYDALFNYVTVAQEGAFWNDETEIIHVLGKDISRFHAVFWPAMLMSANLRVPSKEYITWFFVVNWQKMSKSLWNIIDPVEMVKKYDRDAVIFNLLYDVPIGADGDFSEERMANVFESMLIGWRWNLVNRVTSLCKKYGITAGTFKATKFQNFKWEDENGLAELFEHGLDVHKIEKKYLDKAELKAYLEDRYRLVQKANEFITKAEPRVKYKNEATKQDAISDLQFLLYVVKNLALLSAPILINGFKKIQGILWNEELNKIDSGKNVIEENIFKEVFDMESFNVNLNPEIIYQKKE